jgi:gliding motility associated protien GldN
MKSILIKAGIISAAAFLVIADTSAQTRNPRTRTSGYGNSSGYTTPAKPDTTRKPKPATNQSGYGNSGYGNSGYGGATNQSAGNSAAPKNENLPVEAVKGSGSGIGDSVMPSLRTDNAIDRNLVKDRTPLAYEHIREDDAVYKQRVWREIDTREKMNLPFRYAANEDNGNQRFISILFNAIQSGDVTAFSGEDDRFTTPLTAAQVSKALTGGMDTVAVYNMEGEVTGYQARQRAVEPDSIYRFRLKEEWIFDKESSRMFVRILGIAPIMQKYTSTGIALGDFTLFWAYYPDLRPTLAKYEVYNGKNFAGRMSWEELFESRFFSSYITKSTLDNPFDVSLRQFIKDPLFRLLEGENIKEKIFNYEQDLWSY